MFHVTEVFEPDGPMCVLRARAGEHDCIVPGFDFCQGCGGQLQSRDPTVVKLISDRFGVESVRLPARQECTNAACGRVHEQREMLRRLYSFEPQTAIRPETFYSNTLLNAMMQRQYTSAELEATSLNQSFQARKLADGVDDRGLSLAYHSYFERAMAFKEKAYVTTICKDLDKVHFPSCKCCTGWVKNGAVHELRWYRNMILVVDGNFKLKHFLTCKSLYERKQPFIMYEDDPIVVAILEAREARGMATNANVGTCSSDARSFRADGKVGSNGDGLHDENGIMAAMCPHGF